MVVLVVPAVGVVVEPDGMSSGSVCDVLADLT